MLEKFGLPQKPSLRGSNWVPDASHCQGCSSQFTFLNRRHHCRRCGGLFCGTCTQHRMVLRGQGDSPVRVCEPCKKLEEAARFELRQGRRAGRASAKSTPRDEDEVLNQILGNDSDQHFSSGKDSSNETGPSSQRSVGSASSSSTMEFSNYDDGDIRKIISHDNLVTGVASTTTPDELRQQALEEKKKYKILKGDGKSEEALRAFKRGKELERQADAVEVQLRKARKKVLTSGNNSDMQNIGNPVESGRKTKSLSHTGKEKDDIASELRELGWSDMDMHDEDRKSANLSLEGELSSIIGEISPKMGEEKGRRTGKTQVIVLKKKALMLKREGKLAEAKEELKRAKLLEKQLEEQELLAEAEDSDDELSALIRGMDDDDKKEILDLHEHDHGLEFDRSFAISDDLDSNFEVTDEDMMDPQLAAALESLGWTEPENTHSKSQPFDKEALLNEIQSLKREAVNQKRAGNSAEAMAFLKKAKLLERELNISGSKENNNMVQNSTAARKNVSSIIAGNVSDSVQLNGRNTNAADDAASTLAPKSRLVIQRELLSLKKKALTLRREGKLNEAEEELRKGAALENQLMEMDKASNLEASQRNISDNIRRTPLKHSAIHRDLPLEEGGEDDVTDNEMSDPSYLSLLRDLGWNDESNEVSDSPRKPLRKDSNHFVPVNDASLSQHSTNISVGTPRKSKFEIQRELLGLKRKSLALRREGKDEEAEQVLKRAKELEANMAEIEAPKKEVQVEATMMKDKISNPIVESAFEEGRDEVVSEEDMHDPSLNSMLINLGWKDEELVTSKEVPVKEASSWFTHNIDRSILGSSSGFPITSSRSKGDIQKELLVLKRKALSLRRKGEIEEAEEVLRTAKSLEAEIEDFGPQHKESSDLHNRPKDQEVAMELDKGSASSLVNSSKNVAESLMGLERTSDETSNPLLWKTDNLIPYIPHFADENHPSLDVSASSESPAKKIKSMTLSQDQGFKDNVATQEIRESNVADKIPTIRELHVVNDHASQHNQEILDHKRKAVALKTEGKLAEAREELRRAKMLEKSLEDGTMQPNIVSANIPSDKSHVVQKKQDSSNVAATKPLSGRDRFKLQQESLAHKRQALKLRRDGRMEEAEAEFERAKAIETRLEELADHDSGKLSDVVDDVTVEDFLDPQLLSALKAAGLEDVGVVSLRGPQRQETMKPNAAKIEDSNQERIQLVERIKAEKTKAVNLKRSGKQAEAIDALRRAKMYEKKLNSLISG